MKKYMVHFNGYYGYDVVVLAEDEEQAVDIAEGYEPRDEDFCYEPATTDVWETDRDITYGSYPNDKLKRAEQCLIDNGIEADEASTVLQAIGYILLDEELYK